MTKVEWHPYPKETPEEHEILSQFFVTVKMKGINGQTVTKTEFGRWMPSVSKTGSSYCFGKPKSQEVTAWARIDMPDPYEELDMHPDAIAARRYMENRHDMA